MIRKDKDPMGAAISDFYKNGVAGRLRVFSPQFEEDEIPVETLFREYDEMPTIEQYALQNAKGKILDVGAGAGCHALVLQDMQKSVDAIDVSPLSVETMQKRGVDKAMLIDFYDLCSDVEGQPTEMYKYDTILFLMNGSGIIGKVENISSFFKKVDMLLADGGCVYMDSSDIRYIFEDEDGSFEINLNGAYYGELEYQMQYKRIKGEPFSWLYLDFATLQHYSEENGFKAELVLEGEHYDYLACISRA